MDSHKRLLLINLCFSLTLASCADPASTSSDSPAPKNTPEDSPWLDLESQFYSTPGNEMNATPQSGVCAIRPGASQCTVWLGWSTTDHPEACVFHRESGALVSCNPSGDEQINWVSASGPTFDLRAGKKISDELLASAKLVGAPIRIGAIRFDAWYGGTAVTTMNNLKEVGYKFYERLPFDTELNSDGSINIHSDRQTVMDREMALATTRGIDYWAFVYSRFLTRDYVTTKLPANVDEISNPAMKFNYMLARPLDLYLASTQQSKPKFSLILGMDLLDSYLNVWRPANVTRDQAWAIILNDLRPYLRHGDYLKTIDGRPILFLLGTNWLGLWDNNRQLADTKLAELRAVVANYAGPTFVVLMHGIPGELVASVTDNGFDSATTYGFSAGSNGSTGVTVPFADLTFAMDWFTNFIAGPSVQNPVDTIPPVSIGWDFRPLKGYGTAEARPLDGNWYEKGTSGEFNTQLTSAISFIANNPDRAWSKNLLIYAWNELGEGGYLVPTLAEGSSRLDAIGRFLGRDLASSSVASIPAKIRPNITQSGPGCTDGYGIWLIGSNFGANPIVQLRRAGLPVGEASGGDTIIATYPNPTRATINGQENLSFCLANSTERTAFANGGLQVSVINPSAVAYSNVVVVHK